MPPTVFVIFNSTYTIKHQLQICNYTI